MELGIIAVLRPVSKQDLKDGAVEYLVICYIDEKKGSLVDWVDDRAQQLAEDCSKREYYAVLEKSRLYKAMGISISFFNRTMRCQWLGTTKLPASGPPITTTSRLFPLNPSFPNTDRSTHFPHTVNSCLALSPVPNSLSV